MASNVKVSVTGAGGVPGTSESVLAVRTSLKAPPPSVLSARIEAYLLETRRVLLTGPRTGGKDHEEGAIVDAEVEGGDRLAVAEGCSPRDADRRLLRQAWQRALLHRRVAPHRCGERGEFEGGSAVAAAALRVEDLYRERVVLA
eukprot:scaffold67884_cov80-Phaeocystis_antarctica.AAC.1